METTDYRCAACGERGTVSSGITRFHCPQAAGSRSSSRYADNAMRQRPAMGHVSLTRTRLPPIQQQGVGDIRGERPPAATDP